MGLDSWKVQFVFIPSDYEHMNCRRDPEEVQMGDLTSIVEEMNLCTEVSSILSKFLNVVQAHF